jgi:hypothetical protein
MASALLERQQVDTIFAKYVANIEHRGQCRDNIKTWKGLWTLLLDRNPPYNEELEDEDLTPQLANVVLSHKKSQHDTVETRWYGQGEVMIPCGDYVFLEVRWKKSQLVKSQSVVDFSQQCNADVNSQSESGEEEDFSSISGYSFLIRNGYIMFGKTGNAVDFPDDCIKLDLEKGYANINEN